MLGFPSWADLGSSVAALLDLAGLRMFYRAPAVPSWKGGWSNALTRSWTGGDLYRAEREGSPIGAFPESWHSLPPGGYGKLYDRKDFARERVPQTHCSCSFK